jgi:hypothetical protein
MCTNMESIDRKMARIDQRFEDIQDLLKQAEFGQQIAQDRLEEELEFLANGLRASLDWIAARGWQKYGNLADGRRKNSRIDPPKWLYFPTCDSKEKFEQAMQRGFPNLPIVDGMYSAWEHAQPYNRRDGYWLAHLHELNNFVKHVDSKVHAENTQQMRLVSTQDGIGIRVKPEDSLFMEDNIINGVPTGPVILTPDRIEVSPDWKVSSYTRYTYKFDDINQPVGTCLRNCVHGVKRIIVGSRPHL